MPPNRRPTAMPAEQCLCYYLTEILLPPRGVPVVGYLCVDGVWHVGPAIYGGADLLGNHRWVFLDRVDPDGGYVPALWHDYPPKIK